jgi:CRP-like cAMP-binding protein
MRPGSSRKRGKLVALDQSSLRNRLLTGLPTDAFERLVPHLEMIDLPQRHSLVEADRPTEMFVFLEMGLGSVVAQTIDDEAVEIGHIGLEGVTGAHLFLGTATTPNKTFMQVAGSGLKVAVEVLLALTKQSEELRNFFLSYVHTCEIQMAQSALANARYNMNERLARWLLMCHDRMEGNDLPLTHEFLSLMLGVRRSGVTNEIHILEGMAAIKATRGNVKIINRAKLEEIAGGCYGVAEQEYERLIGLPLKASAPI